jgi:hypothetical protein
VSLPAGSDMVSCSVDQAPSTGRQEHRSARQEPDCADRHSKADTVERGRHQGASREDLITVATWVDARQCHSSDHARGRDYEREGEQNSSRQACRPGTSLRHIQLAPLLLDPSGKPRIQQRAQNEEEEYCRTKSHKQRDLNRGFQQQPSPKSQAPKQQRAWRPDSRDRRTKSGYSQDDTDDSNDESHRRAQNRGGGDFPHRQFVIIGNQPHHDRHYSGKQDSDPKHSSTICCPRV